MAPRTPPTSHPTADPAATAIDAPVDPGQAAAQAGQADAPAPARLAPWPLSGAIALGLGLGAGAGDPAGAGPIRLAFLGRTSTVEHQDPTLSIPRQHHSAQAALPPGATIVCNFYDVESGRKDLDERGLSRAHELFDIPLRRDGGLADLLAEATRSDRRFDAVICESIDRVARLTYQGTRIEHELQRAGVLLLAADEPRGGKHSTTLLTRRVKQAIAEWYVTQLLEASHDGLVEHTQQGWNIGRPPYGYLAERIPHPVPAKRAEGKTKTRLLPDPQRAPTVAQIFAWRLSERLGYRSIAKRLNRDPDHWPPPVPNRPGTALGGWTASAVADILRNPKYTGYMVWNRIAENTGRHRRNPPEAWVWSPKPTHQAIVSLEVWRQAQQVGPTRHGSRDGAGPNRHPHTKRTYVLRSHVRCGHCGRRMCGRAITSRDRAGEVTSRHAYYRCPAPEQDGELLFRRCPDHPRSVYVREDHLVDGLVDFFAERVFHPDRRDRLGTRLRHPDQTAQQHLQRQQAGLQRAVDDLDARKRRLVRALALNDSLDHDDDQASLVVDELRHNLRELDQQRQAKLQELAALAHQQDQTDAVDLLDALPIASDGDGLADLPEPVLRRLFAAFQLQVDYDRHANWAAVQVTLRRDTVAELQAASRDALRTDQSTGTQDRGAPPGDAQPTTVTHALVVPPDTATGTGRADRGDDDHDGGHGHDHAVREHPLVPKQVPKQAAVGGELRLGLPEWFALRCDHRNDPLRAVIAATGDLRPGETAAVQVLARPVSANARRLRRAERAATAMRSGTAKRPGLLRGLLRGLLLDLLDLITMPLEPARTRPAASASASAHMAAARLDPTIGRDVAAILDKLSARPYWELRIRYGVAARIGITRIGSTRNRAAPGTGTAAATTRLDLDALWTRARMACTAARSRWQARRRLHGRAHTLASAFGVYTGRNHLTRHRLHRPAATLAARHLGRGDLIGLPELVALAHLPTDTTVPGLARAAAKAVAPPVVIPSCAGRHGRLLGHSEAGGTRPVALAVTDARQHVHLLGATGSGKSTLLTNLICQDAEQGRGGAVVDPKGDLIRDLLELLPEHLATTGRLVLLDPDDPAPPALNVLDGPDPYLATDHIVGIFRTVFSSSWGPRIDDVLRAACLTLTLPHHDSDQTAPVPAATLADVPRLLTDHAFRAPFVAAIPHGSELGRFWDWYEQLGRAEAAAALGPLLSRLRAVLTRPFMHAVIGQAASSFQMADILDGGLLLARLPKGQLGEETARLLGSFVVARTWQAALARATRPEPHRPDAALYVDEAHNFLTLPGSLEAMFAEARGYHLSLVLAHQHLAQLPRELRDTISANARNKLWFTMSPEDAHTLGRHVAPELGEHDLAHLGAYQAAARLVVGGIEQSAFTLRTHPAPAAVAGRAERLRDAARSRYGRTVIQRRSQQLRRDVHVVDPTGRHGFRPTDLGRTTLGPRLHRTGSQHSQPFEPTDTETRKDHGPENPDTDGGADGQTDYPAE